MSCAYLPMFPVVRLVDAGHWLVGPWWSLPLASGAYGLPALAVEDVAVFHEPRMAGAGGHSRTAKTSAIPSRTSARRSATRLHTHGRVAYPP